MKKINHFSLIAIVLLSINFNCSKDEIILEPENAITEQKAILELNEKRSSITEPSVIQTPTVQVNSTTTLPGNGTNIYYLYLNMDNIENEYNSDPNNPSYTGPFNVFYRNLMSNHFTINHVIQSTNSNCGNVERWIVNLIEFNQYLVSIGFPEVSNDYEDWYKSADPPGNTSSTTLHDVNGVPQKRPKDPPPPFTPPPPTLPEWLVNYNYCFTL